MPPRRLFALWDSCHPASDSPTAADQTNLRKVQRHMNNASRNSCAWTAVRGSQLERRSALGVSAACHRPFSSMVVGHMLFRQRMHHGCESKWVQVHGSDRTPCRHTYRRTAQIGTRITKKSFDNFFDRFRWLFVLGLCLSSAFSTSFDRPDIFSSRQFDFPTALVLTSH